MPAVCVSRSLMVIGALGRDDRRGAGARHRHGGRGERRHEPADGIGEVQPSLFHERQHGHAGDGLGLRRDAEDRVHGHRAAGFLVAPAHGAFVDRLAVAQHQGDRAGQAVLVHVPLQQGVDAPQSLDGEARAGGGGARRRGARRRGGLLRGGERGKEQCRQCRQTPTGAWSGSCVSWWPSYRARFGRRPRPAILAGSAAAPSRALNMRFNATMR